MVTKGEDFRAGEDQEAARRSLKEQVAETRLEEGAGGHGTCLVMRSQEAGLVPVKGQGTSAETGKVPEANFYYKVLNEAEKLDFETAAGAEGLDDEITLLRIKIRDLLEKNPEKLNLILPAANTLARLVKARYAITKNDKKGLGEAIKNVIEDIAVPLGVAALKKKL